MDIDEKVREAAKELGLQKCAAILVPDKTSVFLQFLNDDGKYEQVEVMPEAVLERHNLITVEGLKEEIQRMLEAGESKIIS